VSPAWDRYRLGRRAWLRGWPLRLGPVEIHSTRLASGLLFVALGATFIWFQGSSGLSVLYADLGLDEFGYRAQAWVETNAERVPGGLWLVGLVATLAGVLALRRRRTRDYSGGVGLARP
jgi:hypothetical protein